MPPCTCSAIEATSTPMSVDQALAIGVSSSSRSLAVARVSSIGRCAREVGGRAAVSRQMARAASILAFMSASACGARPGGRRSAPSGRCSRPSGPGGAPARRPAPAGRRARRCRRLATPTFSRAAFIIVNMCASPRLGAPTSSARAPSKSMMQVGEPWMPSLCSMPPGRSAFASPRAPSSPTMPLGGHEQRDAAAALWRVGQAGEHQVDDVVGQVVVAPGDEDLLARAAGSRPGRRARRGW